MYNAEKHELDIENISMEFAFRCDAGREKGFGHFMRCHALATTLRAAGHRVLFVLDSSSDFVDERLQAINAELRTLEAIPSHLGRPAFQQNDYASWLRLTVDQDAQAFLAACNSWRHQSGPFWVIVDHYALDIRWERQIEPHAQILCVDDLANRAHHCAILIDANEYIGKETRYQGLLNPDCLQLLGLRFAMLRPEFGPYFAQVRPRTRLKNILVCYGGSDPSNETGKAARALQESGCAGLNIRFVVGEGYRERQALEQDLAVLGATLEVNAPRLSEFMLEADLGLGAGGSMTWERCYMGLPTLITSIAENQTQLSRDVDQLGLAGM